MRKLTFNVPKRQMAFDTQKRIISNHEAYLSATNENRVIHDGLYYSGDTWLWGDTTITLGNIGRPFRDFN